MSYLLRYRKNNGKNTYLAKSNTLARRSDKHVRCFKSISAINQCWTHMNKNIKTTLISCAPYIFIRQINKSRDIIAQAACRRLTHLRRRIRGARHE